MGIAQRRAAKAQRRKAIVKAKRRTAAESDRELARLEDLSWALSHPTHKASAALIDVADILTDDEDDRETRHRCLILAMAAWNLSLLSVEERSEELRRIFGAMSEPGVDDKQPRATDEDISYLEDIMAQLISRKILLYPFDRRRLLNLDLVETSDGYRVNVASTFDLAA